MNKSLEIIARIRGFISSTNPFRFPHQEEIMLNVLEELENELNPQPVIKETPVVEEPIVEEVVVEEVLEEPTIEDTIIEETPVVEEVVEKPVKKTTRKK